MSDHVIRLAEECAGLNAAVAACRRLGNITIDDHIGLQAQKVISNSRIRSLTDPADFYMSTTDYVKRALGIEAAREADEAVRLGVISTSDHHSSLFCSQTFQGDLLFGELLRRLGNAGRYVPIHSGGQVELGNVTYARGFCVYTSPDAKQQIPVYPSKDRQRLSSHTQAVTPKLIKDFCRRVDETIDDSQLKSALKYMCERIWGGAGVPESGRLGDQTVRAGIECSKLIFKSGDGPMLTYIELEEIARPIIMKEIKDSDSLLAHMLFDPDVRSSMQEISTAQGVPVAGLLFRNADERGRKSLLTLTADGELTGKDWHKEEIRHAADADSLCRLLEERKIFPGLFTIALVLAFERGITWMGGMFQSEYLPEWQACLVRLLNSCGYKGESDLFAGYDCSGYICGPMFAQYEGDGFATVAGPLEFYMKQPEWERLREMMLATGLWDSHLIGLTEMYFDLVAPAKREADWYRKISAGLYKRFSNAL